VPEILPCVICGKVCEPVSRGQGDFNQPYGGTVFYTYGHYGSTVFDDMGRTRLEVTFCDPCLIALGRLRRVQKIATYQPPAEIVSSEKWDREEELRVEAEIEEDYTPVETHDISCDRYGGKRLIVCTCPKPEPEPYRMHEGHCQKWGDEDDILPCNCGVDERG